MISLESLRPKPRGSFSTLVLGIGGAGCNLLDRVVLDGFDKMQLVGINTDIQTLSACVAGRKLQLGRNVTRGLGTGGDPDLGMEATEEMREELDALLEPGQLLFLCAGLGGGTGSGATPMIARMAREKGALVMAFVLLPFSFEGRRRLSQAERALELISAECDAVVCFENDRMVETVSARAGIHEAFAAANAIISGSIRAVHDLASRPGLIAIGLDDLWQALRRQNSRCIFGHGVGEGDNAGHDALARALKSPLLGNGTALRETTTVLVNVSGGPQLTLSQVQILMDELSRHIHPDAHILFGSSVDKMLGTSVHVTILSALGEPMEQGARQPRAAEKVEPPRRKEPTVASQPEQTEEPEQPEEFHESLLPEPREEVPVATLDDSEDAPSVPKPEAVPAQKAVNEAKQEDFKFEPIKRGRFEKSEPTIVEGQDLDVPTFLRKNVRMK